MYNMTIRLHAAAANCFVISAL